MIGMRFNPNQAKRLFFNNPAVEGMLDNRERIWMSRFGAYVRRDMRKSIQPAKAKALADMTPQQRGKYRAAQRRARKAGTRRPRRPRIGSRPGQPPRSRTGLLKKFIYFAFEPRTRSVVIGPAKLARAKREAPAVLEAGGSTTVEVGPRGRRKKKRVRIEPRPYAGPAYEMNLPKVPDMIRDAT